MKGREIPVQLKSIELTGFKSFPDKTRLTFDKPVTAIVGPNGSGKSNIADALMWVTGEQSTKNLRGSKMEDVIFGGTQKRPQMGYAEVSLSLDNEKGELDIEHREVVITRRYYRSGESEYSINRQKSRLRDIQELLMDTGLGREGYSVIGQGKIDEILSIRSRDRRTIFDEAVGISRYRHRREESERKLGQAEENLLRINDKISELEMTLEPLREQSKTAKQYLLLRDELRSVEVSLWAKQLKDLHKDIKTAEENLVTAKDAVAKATAASESLYEESEALELKRRDIEIKAEQERDEIGSLERQLGELGSAQTAIQTNIENNQARIESIVGELELSQTREKGVTIQIREREDRISEIAAKREEIVSAVSQLETQLQEIIEKSQSQERQYLEIAELERQATIASSEKRTLISSLSQQAQELLDRETDYRRELSNLLEELKDSENYLENLERETQQAKDTALELKNALAGYELRIGSKREKLTQAQEQNSKTLRELNGISARESSLAAMEREYEGYSKAVRIVMNEKRRGTLRNVYGTVGSLVKTGEKYTTAVETALGGSIQNIIVKSEQDGKAAIALLKRQDGGRGTFLPLSTIRGTYLSQRGLEDELGFEGIALDLVTYDDIFKGVYTSILGRVAIVETMDDAIRISRKYGARFKVVTLDGQVINAGGSMTGGSTSRNFGIISRAGELERLRKQITELKSRVDIEEKVIDELTRELHGYEFEIKSAREEKLSADETVLKLESQLQTALRHMEDREKAISQLKKNIKTANERALKNEADIKEQQDLIEGLTGQIEGYRSEMTSRDEQENIITEERENKLKQISRYSGEIASLDGEEQAVKKAIDELSLIRRDFEGSRTQQIETSNTLEEQNAILRQRLSEGETQDKAIREEIQTKKSTLSKLTEDRLGVEKRRTEVDRLSRESSRETMELERERSRTEQQKTNKEAEEKRIIDRLWDMYELRRSDAVTFPEPEDFQAATKRASHLRSEISKLGNPNIGAIDEFERVNTRYEFLTSQRDDVIKAKEELDAIIEEITKKMRAIFIKGFAEIEEKFEETFVELFGGGVAKLALEDPSDVLGSGIEITVQPPGKALKTITLLSGGERAFAAIALYFAILKTRPAPFVILDEIEAALDDTNVVRFAEYMRKMSSKTQMIVISHRRGTMEEADVLYGVTMPESGVSRIISLDLEEAEKTAIVR